MAKVEKVEKKRIMPIYVHESVYYDLTALAAIESRRSSTILKKSSFIETKILKPYIAAAKAAGVLK